MEKWDRVSKIVKKELEAGKITPLFDDQTGPTRDLELYDAFGNRKEEFKYIPIVYLISHLTYSNPVCQH